MVGRRTEATLLALLRLLLLLLFELDFLFQGVLEVGGGPLELVDTSAKRTAELIPLCHQLPLTHVEVALEVREASVEIEASAETTAQTGVEMEALVAASLAALTVYDMAKGIDKEMEITDVRLLSKTTEPA